MEENQSVFKTSLNAGLIFGLISIVISLIFYVTDLAVTASGYSFWISLIVWIGAIVFAHNQYKKKGDGFMTYGTGIGIGTLTSVVIATLSSIFSAIYTSLIDTQFNERVIEQSRRTLEESGISDEMIDQSMKWTELMFNPAVQIISSILIAALAGLILSLIITAFTRKKDPSAEI